MLYSLNESGKENLHDKEHKVALVDTNGEQRMPRNILVPSKAYASMRILINMTTATASERRVETYLSAAKVGWRRESREIEVEGYPG
jgi:hypothetical protein